MLFNLNSLVWLLLLIGLLLILQRVLHREVQYIFLLITRRTDFAIVLFSLLFFPGVLLHESSHFIVARLLGVRTGSFSILPKALPNGRLQLGFVETAPVDIFRDALIGTAPLLFGSAFITYVGLVRLDVIALWSDMVASGAGALWSSLSVLQSRPDFWLWFYLVFAISSTILPSASDRRAWLPIALIFALLLVVVLLVGAGPWLVEHLSATIAEIFRVLMVILGVSLAVHIVLVPPLYLLRHLLMRITGQIITSE